ncbi:uncharacterized protein LOC115726272 [Rhodamnia argentea]|uniref:50S ribosomal protein L33, chloroplastic n=1 Tax=Rhodamnia argentea TaxID=178133 RepID=A0A8B8MPN2_9MYRT|nr:uncharacterized protein LOC115726272 [Rhodamnia argentea]
MAASPCRLFFPSIASHISSNRSLIAPSPKSLCFSRNLLLRAFSPGCIPLSARDQKKPLCLSLVCMSYRYAPDSTLRKKKARKRGGDPGKKRKAKRKSRRSKKSVKVINLVSTARTGFSYAKTKSVQSKDKLKCRKYDPVLHQHVLFQE